MDDIRNDTDYILEGMAGEQHCRDYLKSIRHGFFQVDLISICPAGKYYLWEVKHQARFKAPPFDGHGLPLWQVKARLKFYQKTQIRPILYILDKETSEVFVQYLDVLFAGKIFLTRNKGRVIFPIESFKRLDLDLKKIG